ncbi:helix-turn-helix domain-containing protein [Falsiroseomonas tokyonensis]|uniref:Helix-turn-helix domain-containing protein n=1 Tax=Falsiroseomonas tokyonensis TaxID=430521 RepID=A0ABV7C1L2_9PROT|nr:helix-turn-helix transcriptional regulator [Falsiroseomonas tokyonensis]MBU8540963.1 helix-turn-helix transcriptional regulator [Falsiroseomonas tokyonensis]
MAIDPRQIGERLRAWRLGSGLSPEEVAGRLGISRAGLYKYEKDGITRLDLLEAMAEMFGVSLAAVLGIEVEHFSTGAAFFERMRQLEAEAEHVVAYFEPVSILLTSSSYLARLDIMLRESLAGDAEALAAAETALEVLKQRRLTGRTPVVSSMVALPQLAQLLRTGLVGRDDMPREVQAERRGWAREEVENLARLLETSPIGVQVGLLEAAPPSGTFQLVRLRSGRTLACISPFRLADHPNVTFGIATVTAEPATVSLYERLAKQLWARALQGPSAAALLRDLLRKTGQAADSP